MIGYKLFTPEWTASMGKGGASHPYQYEVGQSYEEEELPHVGHNGFHFCQNLSDCFKHYAINYYNRIALVEAYGEIDIRLSDRACATNKIRIIREIPWREAFKIVEEMAKGA